MILQTNVDGAVSGPASAVDDSFVTFNGTSGKVIQDGAVTFDTDGTLAANSATRIPAQSAVKTYADLRTTEVTRAASGKGYVNHGATAGTSRPSGWASIEWLGSVEPSNAIDGDTWVNTA